MYRPDIGLTVGEEVFLWIFDFLFGFLSHYVLSLKAICRLEKADSQTVNLTA